MLAHLLRLLTDPGYGAGLERRGRGPILLLRAEARGLPTFWLDILGEAVTESSRTSTGFFDVSGSSAAVT